MLTCRIGTAARRPNGQSHLTEKDNMPKIKTFTNINATNGGQSDRARPALLLAALATAALAAVTAGGCNTTQGVGEDIEALGDGISDTARDAKD